MTTQLPLVHVTRYVTPLREGGSLPGLVEAGDLGTYVVKFTAACLACWSTWVRRSSVRWR